MNGQAGKRLGGSLTETDVRQTRLARGVKDIIDAVRNVMKGKFINGKGPKSPFIRVVTRRLFGVFVASIITKL